MNNSKHVLITGGTSGIGLAISHAFLEGGYSVSICSRSASSKTNLFKNHSKKVQLLDMDVTSVEEVNSAFENAKAKFGSISILINNAGQARSESFEKSNLTILTEMMSINLHSVYNCTQAALKDMRDQKYGRIINIASTAGLIGYSYTSAYCASKHAVIGLSKSLALELAKTGITVNNICPGFTDTPLVQEAIKNISEKTKLPLQDSRNSLTKFNPMNRLIDPNEIASTALWLASEGASAITGQSISVSGGEVML